MQSYEPFKEMLRIYLWISLHLIVFLQDNKSKDEKKKYIDLDTFLAATNLAFPESIRQIISSSSPEQIDNYTLFSYSQAAGLRLGLIIKINNQADINLSEILKMWELSIRGDLAPLLLQDQIPTAATDEFQDNLYKGVSIRYINFPTPELSIDYAVVENKLIIATSKESIYTVIDRFEEEENK